MYTFGTILLVEQLGTFFFLKKKEFQNEDYKLL